MDGRKYGVSRRPGFLLAEALAVLFLVSLTAAIAFPALWDYEEKRELDLAAETLASAIREVQVLSKTTPAAMGIRPMCTILLSPRWGRQGILLHQKGCQ